MTLLAAVDVGGTTVKAAVYEPGRWTKRAELRRPTARGADPAKAVADQVRTLIGQLQHAGPIAAAGVVVPGVVDEAAGVARFAANLGWRDAPVRELLAERLPMPVAFGHDVTAGGLAEHRFGAARGFADAAFVPVGTGIAAALLIGGRPHRAAGQAGELGHVDVGHGHRCGCGATGCLEVVASAGAIARRYTERSGRAVAGAREVLEADDDVAREVVEEAVTALATGLRLLVTLIAPEVVVLGGGLFEAGGLLERVDRRLAGSLVFQRRPVLRRAELGDEAGCLGAGLLAAELLERVVAP
ncbi:ROK family protein [Amycolatopsis saalfeldensis]|uniref:Glucokinase n=1 Tax=Amycolatopsis saalfeldensis TaxID=394193 RepID=A0A1H8UZV2_9PSEU|nr:ROK family protein [Amycolatopsis saalfeldensis]SEP08685.1 glucokinase [Amycolatopsis saalfeldensis]